jgi:hypothetical protein
MRAFPVSLEKESQLAQPASIVLSAGSGQMQLSWPQDHLGRRLRIQTNGPTCGLGTNRVTCPISPASSPPASSSAPPLAAACF